MKYFAYLDAGTGSMVLQAVAGGAIAVVVFLRSFGHRIKSAFSRSKTDASEE